MAGAWKADEARIHDLIAVLIAEVNAGPGTDVSRRRRWLNTDAFYQLWLVTDAMQRRWFDTDAILRRFKIDIFWLDQTFDLPERQKRQDPVGVDDSAGEQRQLVVDVDDEE